MTRADVASFKYHKPNESAAMSGTTSETSIPSDSRLNI